MENLYVYVVSGVILADCGSTSGVADYDWRINKV